MANFNRKEFGERLRKIRKEKGLTQENLARVIGKTESTIGRFESGFLLPSAEEIYLLCRELDITEYELFNSYDEIINKEKSKNPFGVNKLYVYYYSYYPSQNKFEKCKFVMNIIEKYDYCYVQLADYSTNYVYLEGHLEADNYIAFFRMKNHNEHSKRLECSQFNVNIGDGIDKIMKGAFFATGSKYNTSVKKCLFSKHDLEFTDELLDELKITEDEFENMKEINIWYINTENKQDFEQ